MPAGISVPRLVAVRGEHAWASDRKTNGECEKRCPKQRTEAQRSLGRNLMYFDVLGPNLLLKPNFKLISM